MAVVQHPEIPIPIVNRPERLGCHCTTGKSEENGANLALVRGGGVSLPPDQAGGVEREEQVIFIQKIEGDQALALALVDRSGREEAQGFDWDAEGGRLRGGKLGFAILRWLVLGLGMVLEQLRAGDAREQTSRE